MPRHQKPPVPGRERSGTDGKIVRKSRGVYIVPGRSKPVRVTPTSARIIREISVRHREAIEALANQ